MPTLVELKKLIKSHGGDKPKLSAGKEALLIYAEKQGLLKKLDEVPAPPEPKVKTKEKTLPESLKKVQPVKESRFVRNEIVAEPVSRRKTTKVVAEPEPTTPKPKSSFSSFMSANKGSGLTMTQLAEKYRAEKM